MLIKNTERFTGNRTKKFTCKTLPVATKEIHNFKMLQSKHSANLMLV